MIQYLTIYSTLLLIKSLLFYFVILSDKIYNAFFHIFFNHLSIYMMGYVVAILYIIMIIIF
jgi:hypothetical protein